MPGQRRRKQARERAARAAAGDAGRGPGHWEVLLSTGDEAELRAHVRRLRDGHALADDARLRMDMFCGRLVQPTTYQLSVWVPDPADGTAADPDTP
ncbi:hypothetical protein [Peterkaempfera griseoplana]|uniref:hypothetical protein n=1 Tax=Peterkaempfera griseoplana TaxID=66896 RepID=UPI0007C64040|nr:hypothetical protein [Peterkaempfera griseoplana]